MSGKLDLWPFDLKIGTPVTPASGNVKSIWDFLCFFVYELGHDRHAHDVCHVLHVL